MRIVNNVCKIKMSYISILIALLFILFFLGKSRNITSRGQGGDIEANGDVKGEGGLTTIEWLWIGRTGAPNSLLFCGHHK